MGNLNTKTVKQVKVKRILPLYDYEKCLDIKVETEESLNVSETLRGIPVQYATIHSRQNDIGLDISNNYIITNIIDCITFRRCGTEKSDNQIIGKVYAKLLSNTNSVVAVICQVGDKHIGYLLGLNVDIVKFNSKNKIKLDKHYVSHTMDDKEKYTASCIYLIDDVPSLCTMDTILNIFLEGKNIHKIIK